VPYLRTAIISALNGLVPDRARHLLGRLRSRPGRPVVVVGVALRDGAGRVLAARRHGAGWELPGGKVEVGESERTAGVRECAEELGVQVELLTRLPGREPCGEWHVLRVWTGRIVAGTPVPLVHAELRWVGPDELAGLDWLPADQPFVRRLADGL